MRYGYNGAVKLMLEPQEFTKNCDKEILQYAVGGLLYMPATQSNIAEKIIDGRYNFVKSLVLDLEDSLGDDMLGFGKRSIVKFINQIHEAVVNGIMAESNIPLIFIRVRTNEQILEVTDTLKDKIKYITGFNIPKFDKSCCDKYIASFKQVRDYAKSIDGTRLYIMPIIESKLAMYRQFRMDNLLYVNNALREISCNVLNIRVGGADFNSIFGIRRNTKHTIYDTGVVRSVMSDIINVFAKNYVVSAPVWEYFGTDDAETGLLNELDADAINGFIGKTCIHPSQVKIVQEFNIVNKMDYLDAIGILGMNSNTTGVQKSASGRMNEVKTHSKWANKIISMAMVYGVKE